MVEPPAFRRVHRHLALRAASHLPQRLRTAPALQVPQRRVDCRQREARDRADRGRVGAEEKILPDGLDLIRIAARAVLKTVR